MSATQTRCFAELVKQKFGSCPREPMYHGFSGYARWHRKTVLSTISETGPAGDPGHMREIAGSLGTHAFKARQPHGRVEFPRHWAYLMLR